MSGADTTRKPTVGRSPAAARKRKRLMLLIAAVLLLGVAAALVLTAFRDSIVYFYSPSELATKPHSPGQHLRIGGLVEQGSLSREGEIVRFRVTDLKAATAVIYRGVLPDLFREGQGVVAEGTLGADGVFQARQVLAKHDETYMPPEVAEALKKSGEWRPESAGASGATPPTISPPGPAK